MATNRNYPVGTTPTHADYTNPEVMSALLRHEFMKRFLWGEFMGAERSSMPIIVKEELVKNPGDTILINKRARLSASGVTGDTTQLEGNEETMSFTQVTLIPAFYRHGVALYERTQDKSKYDLKMEAKDGLAEWAADKIDQSFYTAAYAGTNLLYGSGAASSGAMTDSSILTASDISKAAAILRANRVPTVGNSGKYAMIVHPYQAYQLTQDTTWVNGRRDGDLRGKTNPIFEHWISLDVLGIWDGVVVYESPEVPRVAASATDYIAGAVVMGAEAFALGLGQWYKGKFPVQWAEQLADYGNLHGVAVKLCYQSKVLEDSAFVRVYTSCEAPA